MEIFVLTETTVARFLALCLLRAGDPVVAGTDPHVSVLKRPLARLAAWAMRTGRARDIAAIDTLWARFDATPAGRESCGTYTDIFQRIEPDFLAVSDSARITAALGSDYALPGLAVLLAGLQPVGYLLLMLEDLSEGRVTLPPGARFHGLRPELADMHARLSGKPVKAIGMAGKGPRRLVNTGWLVVLALYGMGWLISRLRPARPPVRAAVAVDFFEAGRSLDLAETFVDQPGDMLMVMRNPALKREFAEAMAARGYRSVLPTDGVVTPAALPAAMGELLGDLRRLHRAFADCHPKVGFAALSLAVRRQFHRAFFRRFAVDAFWCCDDYNPEHILRSQELRRAGGRSFGIQHGLPVYSPVHPNWRHIDFDHYFVYGRHFYDTVWHQGWAPHMRIDPVGCWMLTPELAAVDHSGGCDIAVLTPFDLSRPAFAHATRVLAERFADRRIVVCQKPSEDDGFFRQVLEGLPNVHWAGSYATLADPAVRYAVSGISTIAAEAVHFGLETMVLDLTAGLGSDCDDMFAVFPDLCFFSTESVLDRIAELEAGTAKFERELYTGLIEWRCRDPRGVIAAAIRRQVRPCA